MNIEIWITFVMACFVLAISPGAGAVNTMAITMKHGIRRSAVAFAGLQVGNANNIVLVGAGLGALLAQSDVAFSVVKWVGVAYLIYLGIQKCRETGDGSFSPEKSEPIGARKLFFQSVIVNVTNPKGVVFLVALLPQFISLNGSYLHQMLILGGTLLVIDTIVMVGYALLATKVAHLVQNAHHMKVMNRLFGGLFIGAGSLLAATSRS
ncbi:homoserine/homoserine lactone efflux protein [Enterovibrio norvegicus]|uniref:homoserine/homoserine lactone efflux protein n=1 Tax=Enterovibrio norvegicus TaxID=188144 RepID=UPI000C831EFD|nr:homoserine/homoserine lactone efflux protein [Enterovibrio norvegicus]PML76443.1 homoserine/homoserine lactone efflux protein [Enterovibrio norvegicus]